MSKQVFRSRIHVEQDILTLVHLTLTQADVLGSPKFQYLQLSANPGLTWILLNGDALNGSSMSSVTLGKSS